MSNDWSLAEKRKREKEFLDLKRMEQAALARELDFATEFLLDLYEYKRNAEARKQADKSGSSPSGA